MPKPIRIFALVVGVLMIVGCQDTTPPTEQTSQRFDKSKILDFRDYATTTTPLASVSNLPIRQLPNIRLIDKHGQAQTFQTIGLDTSPPFAEPPMDLQPDATVSQETTIEDFKDNDSPDAASKAISELATNQDEVAKQIRQLAESVNTFAASVMAKDDQVIEPTVSSQAPIASTQTPVVASPVVASAVDDGPVTFGATQYAGSSTVTEYEERKVQRIVEDTVRVPVQRKVAQYKRPIFKTEYEDVPVQVQKTVMVQEERERTKMVPVKEKYMVSVPRTVTETTMKKVAKQKFAGYQTVTKPVATPAPVATYSLPVATSQEVCEPPPSYSYSYASTPTITTPAVTLRIPASQFSASNANPTNLVTTKMVQRGRPIATARQAASAVRVNNAAAPTRPGLFSGFFLDGGQHQQQRRVSSVVHQT